MNHKVALIVKRELALNYSIRADMVFFVCSGGRFCDMRVTFEKISYCSKGDQMSRATPDRKILLLPVNI